MSKPLTHHVITRAREILADEKRWTQGTDARKRNGQPTSPYDQFARRFCATGALSRAAFELTNDASKAGRLAGAACTQLCPRNEDPIYSVQRINDNRRRGHAAVLKLFDDYLAAA